MVEPRYTVTALDQSTWAAFAALVEANNGIFGGCWCMGLHPAKPWPDEGQERVPRKRAAKEQRVREGKAHAALVFEGEDCVGWCQFGAATRCPHQEPGRVRKGPVDLARLANRVLLRR